MQGVPIHNESMKSGILQSQTGEAGGLELQILQATALQGKVLQAWTVDDRAWLLQPQRRMSAMAKAPHCDGSLTC